MNNIDYMAEVKKYNPDYCYVYFEHSVSKHHIRCYTGVNCYGTSISASRINEHEAWQNAYETLKKEGKIKTNRVILYPIKDDLILSHLECLRDIDKIFRCSGVHYKNGIPHSTNGYYVSAVIDDDKVIVESKDEIPEDIIRLELANYLIDPTPVETLVAEYQMCIWKSFIEFQHKKNIELSNKEMANAIIAINKAYNLAIEENLPQHIINSINLKREK